MMDIKDLKALTADQIRTFDKARFKEVEQNIRKQLVDLRMEILTDKSNKSGLKRMLRRTLARLLTIKRELELNKGKHIKS